MLSSGADQGASQGGASDPVCLHAAQQAQVLAGQSGSLAGTQ